MSSSGSVVLNIAGSLPLLLLLCVAESSAL